MPNSGLFSLHADQINQRLCEMKPMFENWNEFPVWSTIFIVSLWLPFWDPQNPPPPVIFHRCEQAFGGVRPVLLQICEENLGWHGRWTLYWLPHGHLLD